MKFLRLSKTRLIGLVGGLVIFGLGLSQERILLAQEQNKEQYKMTPADPYQRSWDHFVFKASAKGGAQRGEELYYYKCWYCHNTFAKRAPYLKDIFKRDGVTDQTIADKIRNGGPGMPSYKTTLDDAAVSDLVNYLKTRCCWEGEDPPPNPRYVAGPSH